MVSDNQPATYGDHVSCPWLLSGIRKDTLPHRDKDLRYRIEILA